MKVTSEEVKFCRLKAQMHTRAHACTHMSTHTVFSWIMVVLSSFVFERTSCRQKGTRSSFRTQIIKRDHIKKSHKSNAINVKDSIIKTLVAWKYSWGAQVCAQDRLEIKGYPSKHRSHSLLCCWDCSHTSSQYQVSTRKSAIEGGSWLSYGFLSCQSPVAT